jgi:hypothetical protein
MADPMAIQAALAAAIDTLVMVEVVIVDFSKKGEYWVVESLFLKQNQQILRFLSTSKSQVNRNSPT